MKIITLTGLKQSKKTKLAELWSKNENVSYIQPYTTNRDSEHLYIDKDKMYVKLGSEPPLHATMIDGEYYCHFKSQLNNDFNILIVDDYALKDIRENFDGRIISVWVDDPKGEASERVGHYYTKEDYEYIYNVGLDSPDEFLESLAFDNQVETA